MDIYIIIFTITLFFLILYLVKYRILGFIKIFIKFIELGDYFFAFKIFDKLPRNDYKSYENKISSRKFAIIVQGPLVCSSEFTIETLNYYSNEYPNSPIIFSSWEKDIDKIKNKEFNKNIYFVSNKLPKYFGNRNINLQAISTKSAILYAKKLKCNYVLKTRSDTRIYLKDFQNYLEKLIKFYQFKKNSKSSQKERIISTSFSLRYRLYGISDQIMFGNVDDLYNYFNITTTPLLEKKFSKFLINLKFKHKLYFIHNEFYPEIYFFYNFFKKMNIKLNWTVKDSIKIISNNFIIIDNQSLELYFKKSNRIDNHYSEKPNPSSSSVEFSFLVWLKYFYAVNKIKKL